MRPPWTEDDLGRPAGVVVPLRRRPGSAPDGLGRAYRIAWTIAALTLGAPAAVVGLLSMQLMGTVGVGAAVGALVAVGRQLVPPPCTRSAHVRAATRTTLIGTGTCMSVIGMVHFLGPVGVLLVALLAAGSPPVLSCCRLGLRAVGRVLTPPPVGSALGDAPASAGTELSTSLDGSLEPLTDLQLCLAWRTSFLALQRSQDLDRRAQLVRRRQHCLDELERRNPAGFARWLYTGARPASDPSRYLLGPHHGKAVPT